MKDARCLRHEPSRRALPGKSCDGAIAAIGNNQCDKLSTVSIDDMHEAIFLMMSTRGNIDMLHCQTEYYLLEFQIFRQEKC